MNKKYLMWAVIAVIVLALGGVAYFVLTLPKAHEPIGNFAPAEGANSDQGGVQGTPATISYQQTLPSTQAAAVNTPKPVAIVDFVAKSDSQDCNLSTPNQNSVTNQGTGIFWGSANATSYDVTGEQVSVTGAAAVGSKVVNFSKPGAYTYKAVAHLKSGGTANCSLDITIATASDASPVQLIERDLDGGGVSLEVSPGKPFNFRFQPAPGKFQVFLIDSNGKVADVRVTKTTGTQVEARELRLQKGEHGAFMNFSQVGLYVTPTAFTGNTVMFSINSQKTGS